jgi:hypothetical protein
MIDSNEPDSADSLRRGLRGLGKFRLSFGIPMFLLSLLNGDEEAG